MISQSAHKTLLGWIGIFVLSILAGLLFINVSNGIQNSLNLASNWDVCASVTSSAEHCNWRQHFVPDQTNTLSSGNFGEYTGWIQYKKKLTPPSYCLPPNDGCHLFIAEVGDSLKLTINGSFVGIHGALSPVFQYKKNHPVKIFIPSTVFKPDGDNEIQLTSYSPKKSLIGIRLAPFLLTNNKIAQILDFYILSRNIILPLLVAGLILVIGISCFIIYKGTPHYDNEVRSYLLFIAITILFLISLSEIPREFLPLGPLGFIHYLLRIGYDWSLFIFITNCQRANDKLKSIGNRSFAGIAALFVILMILTVIKPIRIFGLSGFDIAYSLMRMSVPLVLLPGILGAFGPYKSMEAYKPLRISMLLTLPLLLNDVLAFHNVINATYTIKFYPIFIGASFGWILIKRHLKEQETLAVLREKEFIFQQVSHDIRSPLAALEMVVAAVQNIPEDKRLIVRSAVGRIRDIANQLLQKNPTSVNLAHQAQEQHSVQLLSSLIDTLISEKRMQFRSKLGIEITASLNTSAYGLFSKIQPTELKRVLSNLINNAVEALPEEGRVHLTLRGLPDNVELRVTDNGKGIAPEILAKLMNRGETHGKTGGSGLGLYHAQKALKEMGGTLKLESTLGIGTVAAITLPRSRPPEWFVETIQLDPGSQVVILDDDESVHQIWRGRFEALKLAEKGISLLHFSNPEALIQSKHSDQTLYLMDYELLGSALTGLDVIERLGIQKKSILVTSRYEEAAIRERCSRLKVPLIPKGMAGFVPIAILLPKLKPHAILLDDDDLVHMTWASIARKNQRKLVSFYQPEEFFRALKEIDPQTPVYIDSNLSHGIKGQDLVSKVRNLGFETIYLATGYEPDQFPGIPGLTAVVGKDPAPELCSVG